MFIVFDTENRIFGLPRELVITVAGTVIFFYQSFELCFLYQFMLTETLHWTGKAACRLKPSPAFPSEHTFVLANSSNSLWFCLVGGREKVVFCRDLEGSKCSLRALKWGELVCIGDLASSRLF